jgi:hypothetical protein
MTDLVLQLFDALLWRIYGWTSPPAELMDDLAELTEDPEGRLARGPVVIGPVRTTRAYIGAIFALPFCAWLIVSGINDWKSHSQPVAAIVGILMLLMLGWGIFRLWSAGHARLTLDRNGVEFQNASGRLTCPWALFNAVGAPVRSNMSHVIALPINPTVIPQLSLVRADLTQEAGSDVKSSEFKFGKKPDAIELSLLYAIEPVTIGQVLLSVGRSLSTSAGPQNATLASAAREMNSPAARMAAAKPSVTYTGGEGTAELRGRGWITMDTVRAVFPPFCCVCGGSTSEALPVNAVTRYLGFFEGNVSFNSAVPCCAGCQKRVRQREWMGRGIVLAICLAAGVLITGLVFNDLGWKGILALESVSLVIVGVIALVMLRLLGRYGRELVSPIKARYMQRAEKLSFQFSQPGYAELVRDYARSPDATAQSIAPEVHD